MVEFSEKILKRIENATRADLKREAKELEETALAPAQEKFCRAYVETGGDLTRAWIEAGYSQRGKHWKREAQRMAGKPQIFRRISFLRGQYTLGNDITIDWVKRKAGEIVNKAILLHNFKDANVALRLLAEHLRMLPDPQAKAPSGVNPNLLALLTGDDESDTERLRKAVSKAPTVIDVEEVDGKN